MIKESTFDKLIGKDKNKMNLSEKIAYNYLVEIGYAEESIFYFNDASPDFIVSKTIKGRKRYSGWEVKTPSLQFSKKQLKSLDYNTNVIIVEGGKVKSVRRLYEILIPKYLSNGVGKGQKVVNISTNVYIGYFDLVTIVDWGEDEYNWGWRDLFREWGVVSTFGKYPESRKLNIDFIELVTIQKSITEYFNGIDRREKQFKELKETVWWIP